MNYTQYFAMQKEAMLAFLERPTIKSLAAGHSAIVAANGVIKMAEAGSRFEAGGVKKALEIGNEMTGHLRRGGFDKLERGQYVPQKITDEAYKEFVECYLNILKRLPNVTSDSWFLNSLLNTAGAPAATKRVISAVEDLIASAEILTEEKQQEIKGSDAKLTTSATVITSSITADSKEETSIPQKPITEETEKLKGFIENLIRFKQKYNNFFSEIENIAGEEKNARDCLKHNTKEKINIKERGLTEFQVTFRGRWESFKNFLGMETPITTRYSSNISLAKTAFEESGKKIKGLNEKRNTLTEEFDKEIVAAIKTINSIDPKALSPGEKKSIETLKNRLGLQLTSGKIKLESLTENLAEVIKTIENLIRRQASVGQPAEHKRESKKGIEQSPKYKQERSITSLKHADFIRDVTPAVNGWPELDLISQAKIKEKIDKSLEILGGQGVDIKGEHRTKFVEEIAKVIERCMYYKTLSGKRGVYMEDFGVTARFFGTLTDPHATTLSTKLLTTVIQDTNSTLEKARAPTVSSQRVAV